MQCCLLAVKRVLPIIIYSAVYGQMILVCAINSDFLGVYCDKLDVTKQEQSGVLSVFSSQSYIFLALFYGQFVLLCATNSDCFWSLLR